MEKGREQKQKVSRERARVCSKRKRRTQSRRTQGCSWRNERPQNRRKVLVEAIEADSIVNNQAERASLQS